MDAQAYTPMFPLGPDETPYRQVSDKGVVADKFDGETILKVSRDAIQELTEQAFIDINHYLRAGHLQQLASILDDNEASPHDKFVAFELLKNANVAAGGVLPMCQDTGTGIVMAKKGRRIWTKGNDEAAIAEGIKQAYVTRNLRYSQQIPRSMFEEANSGTNLPAQIEIYEEGEDAYKFLYIAKGGGSANKTSLIQSTPGMLNPDRMLPFLEENIRKIGTAACPPYHLAIVVGGMSAEFNLKVVKLASCKYLDSLPTENLGGAHAIRDLEMEAKVLEICQNLGIGAQFGGKYFAHDVRVIRLPRHGASLPVGIGVSCSADRQAMGKITADGLFLEELETDPAKYLPVTPPSIGDSEIVELDLNLPMEEQLAALRGKPVGTRVNISGPMTVARDIAHLKVRARVEAGEEMPAYFKDHPIYYAGPAKTPEGYATGAFGPTTSGRMDAYADLFQSMGASKITLGKGNRSRDVREACKKHGGFYLATIGGPGARLAADCITKVEVIDHEDDGMEAIWRIEAKDIAAFIVINDQGDDLFAKYKIG